MLRSQAIDTISAGLRSVRWKVIIILVLLLVCVHYAIENASLFSWERMTVIPPLPKGPLSLWNEIRPDTSIMNEELASSLGKLASDSAAVPGQQNEQEEAKLWNGVAQNLATITTSAGALSTPLTSNSSLEASQTDAVSIPETAQAHTTITTFSSPLQSPLATITANFTDEYIAICIAIKDQRQDLKEWMIHHYHHLGIHRFYVMDDGSEPPLSAMEDHEFGIPRSAITFNYQDRATREPKMQLVFYDQCLRKYGALHTWIAFIDGDEFLEVSSRNETFRQILEEFEHDKSVGGLGVQWRMHSSSGLLKKPESVRKAFTTCIFDDFEHDGLNSDNMHVKSIVKPSKTRGAWNPHLFWLETGFRNVGEHNDTITTMAWRQPITRDRLALHHYALKSREEYEEKMSRGNGMTDPKGEAFWDRIETMAHVSCPEMSMYHP
ncbi:hypothetical protein BP5796_11933 [Coleophoma crateriformis]|uniref:Glycosyltransferase family 92 protein n=1 Tax=Coleophoma crateriformis TaxID=565419 RepID=A0A3D8QB69_9HELO|nr:hypothetical protein BP5796_11933 [Coleophoma crateriformis]